MCLTHSESGQPCGFEPCKAYRELRADLILALAAADNAEGHVKDILARESKELDEIKRLKAEESELRQRLESSQQDHLDTIIERDALRQDRDRLEKIKDEIIQERDVAERALELVRQDRDRLTGIVKKADALATDVLSNCEDCCERCEECVFATAVQKANVYQEASHAK